PIQKQPKALLCLVGISRRYYLGDDVYPTFHYDDDRGGLIRAPNPTKVKTGSRPRAPHELPLLTLTAPRVIEMDELAAATDSSGIPSAIERSPLDFADEAEASGRETAAPEMPPLLRCRRPKRGREGIDANAPLKSLRRDHADLRPSGVPADVSDPDPLAFADAPSPHPADVAQSSQGVAVARDPESENVSSPTEVGSPGSVYRPEWGVTNAWQVAMGSQLRLRIQARELEIKNLEVLLETEAGIKRAAEEKSAGLSQELERMRAQFSELQVSNERLSQQVDSLQQQVSGEESLKAAFEDYKRHQDQMVEQRCAEMDARLDAMSMSEGLKHGVDHGHAQRTIESLEAYDPEAESKFAAALQSLKDLKLPLLDQLEGLKDAPMDVIMASLYLEDDTGGDASQFIRDLHPSSSQLAIPVYPEVRDPQNPWACKEEIKLADAIAANISRAEQKKRSRIVCRTHGVGSAHHARSDRVSVFAPIVVPQGLAFLLVDAATQTDPDDA
nr:transposase (putative), gypsy type [Tanacetum cinerariifolium]